MRWAALTLGLTLGLVNASAFANEPSLMTAAWHPEVRADYLSAPVAGQPEILPVAYRLPGVEQKESCCGKCGKGTCCGPRIGIFAEYLLITPRDAEVAYAIPVDGPIAPGTPRIPIGPTAVANPDYDSGFRVGFGVDIGEQDAVDPGIQNALDDHEVIPRGADQGHHVRPLHCLHLRNKSEDIARAVFHIDEQPIKAGLAHNLSGEGAGDLQPGAGRFLSLFQKPFNAVLGFHWRHLAVSSIRWPSGSWQ